MAKKKLISGPILERLAQIWTQIIYSMGFRDGASYHPMQYPGKLINQT